MEAGLGPRSGVPPSGHIVQNAGGRGAGQAPVEADRRPRGDIPSFDHVAVDAGGRGSRNGPAQVALGEDPSNYKTSLQLSENMSTQMIQCIY